jgi:hypothetical protein
MQNLRLFTGLFVLAIVVALCTSVIGQKKGKAGRPLKAELTGAAEAPNPGDPDGQGQASFSFNPGQNQICYELSVKNIQEAMAAHIHEGAAGKAGKVVVPLDAPKNGSSKGCADVDQAVMKEIMQNPSNYYVNVHNAEFKGGAVRGQLSK